MVGQKGDNQDEYLKVIIDKIKSKGDNTSDYEKALLKWHKNVDKGYAWVVLIALWSVLGVMLGSYRIYSLIFAKVTNEGIYTREEASWPVSTIYTVENSIGPLISIISYHLNYQSTMLIGGVLLVLANCFTALSTNIYVDVLSLGIVQGVGYAFVFIPVMEIVNNYFVKYRNSALGFALCGGTMSVFGLAPLFEFILDSYPWRFAYYGTGLVSCLIVLLAPLFKTNHMPKPEMFERGAKPTNQDESLTRKLSTRVLMHQSSLRRQSTILISRKPSVVNERTGEAQLSVKSVSPFSNSSDLERKISLSLSVENYQLQAKINNNSEMSKNLKLQECETISMNELGENSNFTTSNIWVVLKTPAFHLIWYCELMYYWIFSINCLVLVDFAIDHGLTKEDSQAMLIYQSIGEVLGRLVLTILVDMRYLSNKNVVVLTLTLIASSLTAITYATTYIWMATLETALSAFTALLFIMLNGLLIDYLGEQQVTLGYGMASCIVGLLITVRPFAVGFCRDYLGSYNPLMGSLAVACLFGALLWIIEPIISKLIKRRSGANKELAL